MTKVTKFENISINYDYSSIKEVDDVEDERFNLVQKIMSELKSSSQFHMILVNIKKSKDRLQDVQKLAEETDQIIREVQREISSSSKQLDDFEQRINSIDDGIKKFRARMLEIANQRNEQMARLEAKAHDAEVGIHEIEDIHQELKEAQIRLSEKNKEMDLRIESLLQACQKQGLISKHLEAEATLIEEKMDEISDSMDQLKIEVEKDTLNLQEIEQDFCELATQSQNLKVVAEKLDSQSAQMVEAASELDQEMNITKKLSDQVNEVKNEIQSNFDDQDNRLNHIEREITQKF